MGKEMTHLENFLYLENYLVNSDFDDLTINLETESFPTSFVYSS